MCRGYFQKPHDMVKYHEVFLCRSESEHVVGIKLGIKLGINQIEILNLILSNPYITIKEMAEKLKISETAVQNNLSKLKAAGIIDRIDSDKTGHWKIIEN